MQCADTLTKHRTATKRGDPKVDDLNVEVVLVTFQEDVVELRRV